LRVLLVERGDFGEATSYNSLRIIHGGLRYLQSLDFQRFRESVQERRWFLQCFPDLVGPLPCLMPLYGVGLQRPSILRVALGINDVLSRRRNLYVDPDMHLPAGRIVSAIETRDLFPVVSMNGLLGSAIWYDAFMPNSQRLLIEVLHWACQLGATALNYMEAVSLMKALSNVAGIVAIDKLHGGEFEFRAPLVVNATGPWCDEVATKIAGKQSSIPHNSLAWNVLFERPAVSTYGVAVASQTTESQTYFMVPWHGRLLAGTGHGPWHGDLQNPRPSEQQLLDFLMDLNAIVPTLQLRLDDIVRVFSGLVPASIGSTDVPSNRETIIDHSYSRGPTGLYSVLGVKFTTARTVANKLLSRMLDVSHSGTPGTARDQDVRGHLKRYDCQWTPTTGDPRWRSELRHLIADESVHHLDDLIMRRTGLGDDPCRAIDVASDLCQLFDWDERRCKSELTRLRKQLGCSRLGLNL
jgi:glycerol-3-phosphate dehydrogenase